jgi:hypothetical protein
MLDGATSRRTGRHTVGYGLFLVALGATAGDLLGGSLGETAAVVVVFIGALAVVSTAGYRHHSPSA